MIVARPLGRWLAAQDPRQLCRRLRLDGWEHLVTADDAGGADGVVIAIDPDGPWPLAAWAIAFYRGGLDLVVAEGDPAEARALAGVGVRVAERLPASGRRAVVGRAAATAVRAVASGDRRRGFRVAFAPTSA